MRRVTVIILLVTSLLGAVSIANASTYLQGTVTASDDPYTNTNGNVYLSCNNNYSWSSDWAYINSRGEYSMDTSNNYYSPCSSYYSSTDFTSCEVYAYPAWNDPDTTLASSNRYPVTIDCDTAATKDIPLNIKDKTIAVSVTAGGNAVTSGISVSCSQQESPWVYSNISTATDGVYNVPVMAGNYYCSAYCSNYLSCSYGGYPSTTVRVSSSDTVKSASLNFALKDKTIEVTVTAGSDAVTSGVTVYCSQQESPWTYSYASTATDGVYSLAVSTGSYYCSAYCSDWASCVYSGYPSARVSVGANDTVVEAALAFTVKNKLLQVAIEADGSAITSGVTIYASEQGGGWSYSSVDYATNGKYVLAVGTAKYYVSAYCTNWSSCDVAGYPNATVDIDESDSVVDITLTFLRNNATISGLVTAGSSGVANAGVSVYSYRIGGDSGGVAWNIAKSAGKATVTGGQASTTMVSSWANTDSNGAFQVRVPAGTYTVSVWPPWDRKDLGQASVEITAAANSTTSASIELPSKTAQISGIVTDATGSGIANVSISGWSYSGQSGTNDWFWTQTDSNGAYSVYAIEGIKYNVSSYFWSSDSSNTVCNYNNEGMQTVVAASTPQTLNFTYPTCDCAVTMNAVDNSGGIISSIYGGVNASPKTLATGEYWYGLWGNFSGGTGTMKVQSDVEYTFSPYVWDTSYVQGDDVDATCTGGAATVNFQMLPLDATISGSYVDSAGGTISLDEYSYMYIYATKGKAYRSCTTSSGGYSCQVSVGEWCMGYWIDPNSGYASSPAGSSTNCTTLTSGGSATSNITLLQTGTINVTVFGGDGNPRASVWIEATPYSNADRGRNDYQHMYMSNGCITSAEGTCSIIVGAASGEGTVYYLNAYIPYYMRSSENIMNPLEVSVTVVAGETVAADALSFEEPDGTSVITVAEGSAAPSISLGKSVRKDVANGSEAASSPIANATVDCFSTSGGSFEVETDENGIATCPCSTTDPWKAVTHNMVANNLWMSESTDVTCLTEGGLGSLTMNNVATVPEGKSVTITDAANQPLTIELSDSFSVFFPQGSLGGSGEQVTCNVDVTVTPFTANRRPASFYGYTVNCQDGNGSAIIALNSNATFSVPVNKTQVENIGLTMDDIEMSYFDDSTGAYSAISTATINDSTYVITYQQNHLTDFVVTGNGNLAGISGEDAGDGENEHGADASGTSSGTCGCRMGAETPLADKLLILAMFLSVVVTLRILSLRSRRRREKQSPPPSLRGA